MLQIFDHTTPQPAQVAAPTSTRQTQYLLVISIVFAFAGQALLLKTNGDDPREGLIQVLAGSLLIIGAGLFGAFVTSRISFAPRLEFPDVSASSSEFAWRKSWMLSWLIASGILAILAISLFVEFGESTIVVLIWIASIFLLFIASQGDLRITRPHISSQDWIYQAAL